MAVIELCVEDVDGVRIAAEEGVDRVELCRELWCGGLTPPPEQVQAALAVAPPLGVQVLIREQADTFMLGAAQVDELCRIMESLRNDGAGPLGFVVGAMTEEGEVDQGAAKQFREAAGDSLLTFHRAFDLLEDQRESLELLIDIGFDCVLTTGGSPSTANTEQLRRLVRWADGRIQIIGSGGVRSGNVAEVVREGLLPQVHMRAPGVWGSGTSREEVRAIVRQVRAEK